MLSGSYEKQHLQQQQQQHHQREQLREQHSRNMHHVISDSIDQHTSVLQLPHLYNGQGEEDERYDEKEHFNENHQYAKQQSFLHSTRKISNHLHAANTHSRDFHLSVQQGHQSQNLDANYIGEEHSGGTTSPSVTRYSLLQFAMQHFRNE